MRAIRPISSDEMIATFLGAEIRSSRFASAVEGALSACGADRTVIEHPDLADERQNKLRQDILAASRGYGRNADLFQGFPGDVRWSRAWLGRDELARLRYVDYGYWNRLSGGTRRVADGARNVRNGLMPYGVSNEPFHAVASEIVAGRRPAEPILVAVSEDDDPVILEGHLRMTAYALAGDGAPDEIEVIIGVSEGMRGWIGTFSPHVAAEDRMPLEH